jgi:hypothetical protein
VTTASPSAPPRRLDRVLDRIERTAFDIPLGPRVGVRIDE